MVHYRAWVGGAIGGRVLGDKMRPITLTAYYEMANDVKCSKPARLIIWHGHARGI